MGPAPQGPLVATPSVLTARGTAMAIGLFQAVSSLVQTTGKYRNFTKSHKRKNAVIQQLEHIESHCEVGKWCPVLTLIRLADSASTLPFSISGREPK